MGKSVPMVSVLSLASDPDYFLLSFLTVIMYSSSLLLVISTTLTGPTTVSSGIIRVTSEPILRGLSTSSLSGVRVSSESFPNGLVIVV